MRPVIPYLILAAVTVAALVAFQHHVNTKQDKFQNQMCRSLGIVHDNQRFVLMTLGDWEKVFSDRTKAGLRPVPPGIDNQINARLKVLNHQVVCRP